MTGIDSETFDLSSMCAYSFGYHHLISTVILSIRIKTLLLSNVCCECSKIYCNNLDLIVEAI